MSAHKAKPDAECGVTLCIPPRRVLRSRRYVAKSLRPVPATLTDVRIQDSEEESTSQEFEDQDIYWLPSLTHSEFDRGIEIPAVTWDPIDVPGNGTRDSSENPPNVNSHSSEDLPHVSVYGAEKLSSISSNNSSYKKRTVRLFNLKAIPRWQPLTPIQIEKRCEQNHSSASIQRQFGRMSNEWYKSVTAKYVLSEFKSCLMKISPSVEVSKEISRATSHTKALIAVHDMWSWDNYDVLRKLLLTLGDADDLQRLKHYDQELAQYLANKETADCDDEEQPLDLCDHDDMIISSGYHSKYQNRANQESTSHPVDHNHEDKAHQELTSHPVDHNHEDKANQESTSHPDDHNHEEKWDPYAIIDRHQSEGAFIQGDHVKHMSKEDMLCENQFFCNGRCLKSKSWYHNSDKTPETM